ncbi:MAG: RNase adapter RapZ [Bdellovibrionales bacterium]|nr:RNase adapter RapZ [Bdellovibrionales bacterium]
MEPREDVSHIRSLVLLVGLSGAGKSTANRAFSDEGYFSIDNLPIALLPNFLALSRSAPERFEKTSVLLDIVSEQQREQFFSFIEDLPIDSQSWQVLFLDASVDELLKRYSETRRPHPATWPEPSRTVQEAITWERELLQPVKERANIVIDSSRLTPHDMRREIRKHISSFEAQTTRKMRVHFQSFGFKYGAPTDCDLLIDVRFLPNPHFHDELRPKTGLEEEVKKFVLDSAEAKEFIEKYIELLNFLLPHYSHEGKAYLNIGVGCTGGKHRSVAVAQHLSSLISKEEFLVSVSHRDREKALKQDEKPVNA